MSGELFFILGPKTEMREKSSSELTLFVLPTMTGPAHTCATPEPYKLSPSLDALEIHSNSKTGQILIAHDPSLSLSKRNSDNRL